MLPQPNITMDAIRAGNNRSALALGHALQECHTLLRQAYAEPLPDGIGESEKWLGPIPRLSLPADVPTLLNSTSVSAYKIQRTLGNINARLTYRRLWSALPVDSSHRIQLLAKSTGTPSLALSAIPTEPAMMLSNKEMVIMLRQYLGLALESTLGLPPTPLRCCCSGAHTTRHNTCNGDHLYNCKQQSAFVVRHTAIMSVVAECFKSVGIEPEIERVVHTAPQVGANNNRLVLKRFDVVAPAADPNSRMLCMDITVTSHVTKEYHKQAALKPLVNANNSCTAKHTKYRNDVHQDTEVLVPLVAETSGALHQNFKKLYEHLATRANGRPPLQANWAAPTYAAYWMQRTSCTLWRETARALMRIAAKSIRLAGRQPSGPYTDVMGSEEVDVPESL